MSSGQIFVLAIIAIIAIAGMYESRIRAMNGIVKDEDGNERLAQDPEAAALREEVKMLKERLAVLERIATDGRKANELEAEIEKLRLK
jgi:hypothetical protein